LRVFREVARYHIDFRDHFYGTHLYITDRPITVLVKTGMAQMKNNFWTGAGIGAVIIIIIDLLVPFLGPLLGGFVAGFIAKGDVMNAGKAGFVAGILATIVIGLVIVAGMLSPPIAEYIPQMGTGYFLFITITLYLALFALFGGLIAGAVRR
jgi:hypothetical protein